MPAEKEREGREKERYSEIGEKERILSYKWLCEEMECRSFFRQVSIEVVGSVQRQKWSRVWGGVWGVSPLPYREGLGGGSLDIAVGDR